MQLRQGSLYQALALALTMAATTPANAGRLELLLSAKKGTESAEAVVNDANARDTKAGPIATAIIESGATQVSYLLLDRATGDYAAQLASAPDSARAQLERYVVLDYPEGADLLAAREALSATEGVVAVFESTPVEFPQLIASGEVITSPATQYHLNALRIPQAWQIAGGYGQVGMLESGVEVTHPDLVAINGAGHFTGGNLLPPYSLDLGPQRLFNGTAWVWDTDHIDLNPDEMQPVPADLPACDVLGDGLMRPSYAGHGTHTTGLVSANAGNGDVTQGVCEHCGVGVIKVIGHYCTVTGFGAPFIAAYGLSDSTLITRALMVALDGTANQVINMSFATILPLSAPYHQNCPPASEPQPSFCLALEHAVAKDVVLVAASGNSLSNIQFPARDPRVIAVGGLNSSLTFWDDFAGSASTCPTPFQRTECGSNFTQGDDLDWGAKQELVAPAKSVVSTMYHGVDWNSRCGDSVIGTINDGVGACTGTSMSAPMVSGIVGILRSVNPLVRVGTPEDVGVADGIRDALRQTTDRAQAGLPWDIRYGYGRPDAEAAVRRMLGRSGDGLVVNRLTPLFRLYSNNATDFAFVTVPQAASALMINASAPYVPSGILTPGYTQFPAVAGSPRATAYVLTTQGGVGSQWPGTLPMYLIHRKQDSPVGCTPGTPGCNSVNRDFSVAVGTTDLEARIAQGYEYRGLQGYILARCTSPSGCAQPQGAEALYRKCKVSEDDCAVFLERDRVAMQNLGYTTVQGAPADGILGYAFANVDTDGDTLVDGFEYLLGTSPFSTDSDNDSCTDAYEYPAAGIPRGNPLSLGPIADC